MIRKLISLISRSNPLAINVRGGGEREIKRRLKQLKSGTLRINRRHEREARPQVLR